MIYDQSGNSYTVQAFIQGRIKLSPKLTFTPGFHSLYLELNEKFTYEPRAGLSWDLNQRNTLAFGFGIHSQIEPLTVYFANVTQPDGSRETPNTELDFSKSAHFVLSYSRMFGTDLRFKTEVYYQHLYDLPVLNKPPYTISPVNKHFPSDTLVNEGTGMNYGIELMLEKYFTNRYYFLITSSLFDSKIKYLVGDWYNTRYNVGFVHNIIAGKEFVMGRRKTNFLGINGKLIWSGGKRYTPSRIVYWDGNPYEVTDYSKSYSEQVKDYFRLDLSVSYTINRSKTSHTISLDIQNVTNRQNILSKNFDLIYSPDGSYRLWDVEEYMMGFMPIFNYRIEF